MGTFISQIRHCAQVLVPATVYSCLAAVFDIFEIGSLQESRFNLADPSNLFLFFLLFNLSS